MIRDTLSPLRRQLGRVRRRLFLRLLGRRLVLCSVPALLLAAVGLLVLAHGHVRGDPSPADGAFLRRLAGVGAALTAAIFLAVVLALWRRPSRLAAALSLDRDAHLKERVTTCLCLTAEQTASPAGMALIDDAVRHADTVTVRAAFPLRPSRAAALVPASLLVALLTACFCEPPPAPRNARVEEAAATLPQPEEVARRLRQLSDRSAGAKRKPAVRGEEARAIEAELERLADERPTTYGEGRELLKDLTALEDRMRRQETALAERANALRRQAEEADRLTRKKQPGPPPTVEQSLAEGDFRAAADELRRLERQTKAGLTPEKAEQLRRQLEELKERLDRLADLKEKQDQAQAAAGKDGLSQEELKQLDRDKAARAVERAELKEAAEELGRAAALLRQRKDGEAAERLGKAGQQLKKLDSGAEQAKLAQQLALLQEAKSTLARNLGGRPQPASGRRPETAGRDGAGQDTRVRGARSAGQLSGLRHVPGAGLKGPQTPAEFRALIEDAGREAAEALDRQRLPRSAGDTARGYFERLRGSPPSP